MPIELPLLDRPSRHGFSLRVTSPIPEAPALLPGRTPQPGEQYRFHFDMAKCIGCKCCVVACNEQNGNPAELNWRRVGEIEGGTYPDTQRWHLSMGCNQCLEPSCLIGCPVEAYSKDPVTGIVDHDPDICIGCQYCTWNCSYGVPQYNPERGVVGKCDMCHGRLNQGLAPACVNACPAGAIAIEIVNMGHRTSLLPAFFICSSAFGAVAERGRLRAGAARVDITPPVNPEYPPSGKYEHERLYVRAIVLDNGLTRAALLNADLGNMPEDDWTNASKQIAEELKCPLENIIMSAIHTHSGVAAGPPPPGPPPPQPSAPLVTAMMDAVRQAKAKLQPALVGFGTGFSYLNANRDVVSDETHRWTQAPNLIAASDKTVVVVSFTTTAGDPIAVCELRHASD